MLKRVAMSAFLAAAAALCLLSRPADAQGYTVLHSFKQSEGWSPVSGLAQGTDGNFYGTTWSGGGGNRGTVFQITPSGTLTTLHSFAGSDGAYPFSGGLLRGTDGNFYGNTQGGGANDDGTVFKITPSGTLTTLHSFTGSDGQNAYGLLVQGTDGNFYGTTFSGGFYGAGTVFKITPSGTLTTLHSFNSYAGSDGYWPVGGLVQGSDGNFYGTTQSGGTSVDGTVFKITPGGTLTTLYSFDSFAGSDGGRPLDGLVQGTDGNFYGTTLEGGGTNRFGTVFKITPGGTLTTLHSFSLSREDGGQPVAGLVQGGDGNFYGTTPYGGAGLIGTIFRITPSGTLTTLHSFTGSDGFNPQARLMQGTDGNFYGTTFEGGANGGGVVFRWPPEGSASVFYPLTPCRAIDTRIGLGGPALVSNGTQNFYVAGVCGIPAAAVVISANLTVTNVTAPGELVVFPADVQRPNTSTLSFRAGRVLANNALVALSTGSTTFSVFNNSAAAVDFIVDVNGYFQ